MPRWVCALILGLTALLAGAWGASGLAATDVPAPASVPADVLLRSDQARANMQQIAVALMIYANDHNGQIPADLTVLYPTYIHDPLVFWHPGDTDPPPTTIDNNQPNQPNSTRISYEYAATLPDLCSGSALLWDNTAANNGGLFINRYTEQGIIAEPAWITPTPTRLQVAQNRLRTLGQALFAYAMDHDDEFPDDFAELAQGYLDCSPAMFWNPGDSDPQPTDITNSVPNAANSPQISFDYLGAGRSWGDVDPNEVLLQDNSPANNGGYGVNVIFGDGHFKLLCHDPFADVDDDGDVDQDDFGWMQRCLSGPGQPIASGCACLDWPGGRDGVVDQQDLQRFLGCVSGPALPVNPACDNP